MIPFGSKSMTLSMLIDLLTSRCRSTQVKLYTGLITSIDLWPQEMFTFSEMLVLVQSESSSGAYVCHRRPAGLHSDQRSCYVGVHFKMSSFLQVVRAVRTYFSDQQTKRETSYDVTSEATRRKKSAATGSVSCEFACILCVYLCVCVCVCAWVYVGVCVCACVYVCVLKMCAYFHDQKGTHPSDHERVNMYTHVAIPVEGTWGILEKVTWWRSLWFSKSLGLTSWSCAFYSLRENQRHSWQEAAQPLGKNLAAIRRLEPPWMPQVRCVRCFCGSSLWSTSILTVCPFGNCRLCTYHLYQILFSPHNGKMFCGNFLNWNKDLVVFGKRVAQ